MKFLKEDYGQSPDLNSFVYEAKYRFNTYYKVTILRKIGRSNDIQENYFAFKDAATDYYNKLLKDLKNYNWDDETITLSKITVNLEEEQEEEYSNPEIEEEEEIIEEE